ncbi:hypothetical protein BU14_0050s0001 [Porphyra umbilicalis]|uniref:Uncharacterized protein n=1 Tax=Porphyra umbilicalis TaxID=2786 RepID=A0A1X6PIK7_PORUM|nr:hypothetical protein BU14_0050s0001 [Porphyra umbilicalis]|eukprot:OSX80528.1 hypothetical protein BU14_0050s0001 [Porphyra umbilicalis]
MAPRTMKSMVTAAVVAGVAVAMFSLSRPVVAVPPNARFEVNVPTTDDVAASTTAVSTSVLNAVAVPTKQTLEVKPPTKLYVVETELPSSVVLKGEEICDYFKDECETGAGGMLFSKTEKLPVAQLGSIALDVLCEKYASKKIPICMAYLSTPTPTPKAVPTTLPFGLDLIPVCSALQFEPAFCKSFTAKNVPVQYHHLLPAELRPTPTPKPAPTPDAATALQLVLLQSFCAAQPDSTFCAREKVTSTIWAPAEPDSTASVQLAFFCLQFPKSPFCSILATPTPTPTPTSSAYELLLAELFKSGGGVLGDNVLFSKDKFSKFDKAIKRPVAGQAADAALPLGVSLIGKGICHKFPDHELCRAPPTPTPTPSPTPTPTAEELYLSILQKTIYVLYCNALPHGAGCLSGNAKDMPIDVFVSIKDLFCLKNFAKYPGCSVKVPMPTKAPTAAPVTGTIQGEVIFYKNFCQVFDDATVCKKMAPTPTPSPGSTAYPALCKLFPNTFYC